MKCPVGCAAADAGTIKARHSVALSLSLSLPACFTLRVGSGKWRGCIVSTGVEKV